MNWLNCILVATDFSDCAAQAQEYALFLASACKARLDFVHAFELVPGLYADEVPTQQLYLEEVRRQIDRRIEALVKAAEKRGVAASGRQMHGIASEQIIEAAREQEADLIVVGTHGRTGLAHVLLGSTAERVIKGAPCPVMTVRCPVQPELSVPFEPAKPAPHVHQILAPVDFSDCSLDALEYTVQVAKQFAAAVTILHVLESPPIGLNVSRAEITRRKKVLAEFEARLSDMVEVFKSQALVAQCSVREGAPADVILGAAQEYHADLIIMGTHGRRGVSRLLFGSVAEAVLRRSPSPVLTVKSPKFSPGHRRVLTSTMNAER